MSQTGNSEIPQIKSRIGAILRATSGNFLEQFDFFLFGFYASAIAKAFFPAQNETAALLNAFGVFWLGALMRPVGAIVLGAYIDRIGRRKGLIVTLGIMAIGTVVIAFCPTYASIGLAAPVIVLVGRARLHRWALWAPNLIVRQISGRKAIVVVPDGDAP